MNASQKKNVERFTALILKKVNKGALAPGEELRLESLRDLVEVQDYIKEKTKTLNNFIKLIKG